MPKADSKIEAIKSTGNIRGNRSKLIGFYCSACNVAHIDFPIIDMVIVDETMAMCEHGLKQIMKYLE